MPLVDVNANQDRVIQVSGITCLVLQLGDILVRVQRHNSIVMVARRYQHRGVLLFLDVVQGRVPDEVVVGAGLIGIAVFRLPEVTTGKFVEPEHVGDWDLGNGTSKEVGALIGCDSYQSPAIRASERNEVLVVREPLILKVLSCPNKIIEALLSIFLNSFHMPILAKFTTATDVCKHIHSVEVVDKDEVH